MNIFHARENDMTRGSLFFSRVVEARNGTIFRFDVVVDRLLFFVSSCCSGVCQFVVCARVNSSGTGGRGDSSRCFSDE